MKGIIFNILADLITDKFGISMLNQCIESCDLPSGGIYTSVGTYDDSEVFALVGELSKRTNIAIPDLIRAYGEYMLQKLIVKYPKYVAEGMTLQEFLMSINDVIHVEVLKLYPDATVPEINCKEKQSESLTMTYRSPRKLCFLAEGMILGAANYFGNTVEITQPQCMHDHADCCHLVIRIQ